MVVLQAAGICKSYGTKNVLDKAGITLQAGERVGLVGPNGSGKTTLLKILTGCTAPDAGEVVISGGASLGYLAQDSGLSSGSTVMEEMLSVFQSLINREEVLRDLERRMSDSRLAASPQLLNEISGEYAALSEDFRSRGGYEFRASVKAVLHGLKFGEEYHQRVADTLSGGQKTRLALARLLLAKPGILVMDEPTNHLDMETLSWMEKYLMSYTGTILAVSHDRYFLDALAGTVYELERGRLHKYTGNYSRFVTLKEEQRRQEMKLYRQQQDELARAKDFIRRNIARASTTGRAQSRQKALEKVELLEKPADLKSASFSFSARYHSGRDVLTARGLKLGYGDKALAGGLNLCIERGERVALVGPNGAGKSTLLKTTAGLIRPLGGYITLGTNVSTGYYDQEQSGLSGSQTVLDELWNRFPHMDEKDVRGLLGSFLFSGDDVYKKADQLSGGEKARLALAKLMLQGANFLLLDEPTNHLDVYSREVLEEALADFNGTILFVSHDRYFLNKLATRVIEINPSGLLGFPGNYDNFREKKDSMAGGVEAGQLPPAAQEKEMARLSYQQEKEARRLEEKRLRRIEELEKAIETAENLIAGLEKETYQPEVYRDLDLLLSKNAELEKQRSNLDCYYTEWESLNKL